MGGSVETFGSELDGGTGGVSIDRDGNVYVADFGAYLDDRSTAGRKIFKLDRDGTASVFATGFDGASGNAFDAQGDLYQSNIRGGFLSRVTPEGHVSEFAREGFVAPVGIAIDEEGALFVADCNANRILRVSPEGRVSTFAESRLFRCPNGVALDSGNNLYVANFDNGDVLKVTPAGKVSLLARLPGGNNGHVRYHDGSLFVVARGDHRIYRVSLRGEAAVFAGTGRRGRDDGPVLEASFSYPNDLRVGPDGRTFYVNQMAATEGDPRHLAPMIVRRIRLAG